jgi:hypothetical protein
MEWSDTACVKGARLEAAKLGIKQAAIESIVTLDIRFWYTAEVSLTGLQQQKDE